MQISTADLRALFEKLLTHLEQTGYSTIELTDDYYWNIPKDSLHNPYQQPDTLTLGQLSENWQELQAIISGDKEPIGYALVWLSSITRAIGEDVLA